LGGTTIPVELELAPEFELEFDVVLDLDLELELELDVVLEFVLELDLEFVLDLELDVVLELVLELDLELDLAFELAFELELELEFPSGIVFRVRFFGARAPLASVGAADPVVCPLTSGSACPFGVTCAGAPLIENTVADELGRFLARRFELLESA